VLGDALGLTSVHINRTLQAMRRDGLIVLKDGIARLSNVDQLARMVDARPPRLSRPPSQ
jgi:biotin operon repressor